MREQRERLGPQPRQVGRHRVRRRRVAGAQQAVQLAQGRRPLVLDGHSDAPHPVPTHFTHTNALTQCSYLEGNAMLCISDEWREASVARAHIGGGGTGGGGEQGGDSRGRRGLRRGLQAGLAGRPGGQLAVVGRLPAAASGLALPSARLLRRRWTCALPPRRPGGLHGAVRRSPSALCQLAG